MNRNTSSRIPRAWLMLTLFIVFGSLIVFPGIAFAQPGAADMQAADAPQLTELQPADTQDLSAQTNDSTNPSIAIKAADGKSDTVFPQTINGVKKFVVPSYADATTLDFGTMGWVKSANVMTMYITSTKGRAYVDGAPVEAKTKDTGTMRLVSSKGEVVYDGELTQIKGRGNSTWNADKKPYQIKLADKAALLDGKKGNAAKTWVLLANAYDDTDLHNYVALRAGLAAGLSATPECAFVDLYYDGEYRGLYLLSEKIQIGKGRIEIDEIKNEGTAGARWKAVNSYGNEYQYVSGITQKTDAAGKQTATGGYLLELDNGTYKDESSWFTVKMGDRTSVIVVKEPEDATQAQVKYISEYMQRAIDEAMDPIGSPSKYIDLDSLARFFLVNEFAKNSDYLRYSSTFFYKGADPDILHAGPLWDFDLAFGVHIYEGNADYLNTEGFAAEGFIFFWDNLEFQSVLKRVYDNEVAAKLDEWKTGGTSAVKAVAATIKSAADIDWSLWGAGKSHLLAVHSKSFDNAVDYLAQWVDKRLAGLSKEMAAVTTTEKTLARDRLAVEMTYLPDAAEVTRANRAAFAAIRAKFDKLSAEDQAALDAARLTSGEAVIAQLDAQGAAATRLAGAIALDTMEQVVDAANFPSGGTVVLATSEGYWDALTAAGLAGLTNAPILMTDSAELSSQTANQLTKLRPKTIVVCGGTAAISNDVASQAASAAGGASLKRCAGAKATDTAVDVFRKTWEITGIEWEDVAFVCTNDGYWDALACAPVSYRLHIPIFLAEGHDELTANTLATIRANYDTVYLVGGTAALSESVESQLKAAGVTVAGRFAGDTAVETSTAVAQFGLDQGMIPNRMGVATMNGYWDALSAAALCGKNDTVVVLAADDASSSISGFMKDNAEKIASCFVFGGEAAIDPSTYDAIKAALR